MRWRLALLLVMMVLGSSAEAQMGLPAGVAQMKPGAGAPACPNSLDFSNACDSANLAVIL